MSGDTKPYRKRILLIGLVSLSTLLIARIISWLHFPDYFFKPAVQVPLYPDGDGPVIFFDEALFLIPGEL